MSRKRKLALAAVLLLAASCGFTTSASSHPPYGPETTWVHQGNVVARAGSFVVAYGGNVYAYPRASVYATDNATVYYLPGARVDFGGKARGFACQGSFSHCRRVR